MHAVAAPWPGQQDSGQCDRGKVGDVANRLRIDVDHRDSAVIVRAHGEVDAYTLPTWRQAIREAVAHTTETGPVIVDITRLEFMACCALVALALDADVCRAHGIDLIVVTRASIVRRIAAAAELDGRLCFCSGTETALAGHRGGIGAGP
jgi:anti-anti-sigma factor